jgi:hypothetical protein
MTNDVRELFEAVQASAPPLRHTVDDVVAGGRRVRRRRRAVWATGAGTAAAVVAVAVAVAVPQIFTGGGGRTLTPAAPRLPAAATTAPVEAAPVQYPQAPWDFTLTGYQVGPFAVSDAVHVTPGYQQAAVVKDGFSNQFEDSKHVVRTYTMAQAVITVYRPGAFKPDNFKAGTAVTVNGRPGLQGDVGYLKSDKSDVEQRALAWQYADGAWAVLSAPASTDAATPKAEPVQGMTRQQMIDVASGLRSGPPKTATLPYTVGHLPSGYKLTAVGPRGEYPFGAGIGISWARYTKDVSSYTGLTEPVISIYQQSWGIRLSVGPAWDSNYPPAAGDKASCPESGLCYRTLPGGTFKVQAEGGGESDAELKRVLDGLTFADPTKPETWPAVTTAVPARVQ